MKIKYGFRGKETTVEEICASVGPGWAPLLRELITDLFSMGWDGVVLQVKEKFGGLRFYIGSSSVEVFDRIQRAENDSFRICEDCGAEGRPRNTGWIRTLCDACLPPNPYPTDLVGHEPAEDPVPPLTANTAE